MLRQSLNGERLILGGHTALRSRRGAQGIGLVVTFLVLAGMRQRALGEGLRLLQMTGQELRLAQSETTERLQVESFQRHGLLHPPLEHWYHVIDAPAQRVRCPQGRSYSGKIVRQVRIPTKVDLPFEQGKGPGHISLAQGQQTNSPRWDEGDA